MHRRTRTSWAAVAGASLAVLVAQAFGAVPAAATTIAPGTVQVIAVQTPFTADNVKTFSANCPAGKRVLGGGAFTVGGVHAVITEMQPITTAGGDRFQVTAAEDQFGVAGTWSFQVFAFCATVPAAVGLQIVTHVNLPTTAPTDQAPTQCPPGKAVVGAGGKIDNGAGQVDLGIFPNSSGGRASGTAAFAKQDADGFAGAYTVTGYSVCANEFVPQDIQIARVFTSPVTTPSQKVTFGCPSGLRLTGLGGATVLRGTHLQQLKPNQTAAPNVATIGTQSSVPPAGAWTLDATVFCAR
jgi:hypothetical protein